MSSKLVHEEQLKREWKRIEQERAAILKQVAFESGRITLTEGQVVECLERLAILDEQYTAVFALIEGLGYDPIVWGADFDMFGHEIGDSTGWVRIQPHWDDLRSPGTGVTASGAKKPSFLQFRNDGAGSVGAYAYLFPPSTERELFGTVQMPHAWVEGTEIEPHIHWCPSDTSAGNVLWALEYTVASIGEAFPTTTTTYALSAASGIQYQNQIAGFEPDIDMTGQTLSCQVVFRFYRDSTAPEDDYGVSAWLNEIDFHFQLDGLGSNQTLFKTGGAPGDPRASGTLPIGGGGSGKLPTPGE